MKSPRWNRDTAEATPPKTEPLVLPEKSAFDPSLERFAIGDELGRGGMGRVMAATDTSLDRSVAIKQALGDDSIRYGFIAIVCERCSSAS